MALLRWDELLQEFVEVDVERSNAPAVQKTAGLEQNLLTAAQAARFIRLDPEDFAQLVVLDAVPRSIGFRVDVIVDLQRRLAAGEIQLGGSDITAKVEDRAA